MLLQLFQSLAFYLYIVLPFVVDKFNVQILWGRFLPPTFYLSQHLIYLTLNLRLGPNIRNEKDPESKKHIFLFHIVNPDKTDVHIFGLSFIKSTVF